MLRALPAKDEDQGEQEAEGGEARGGDSAEAPREETQGSIRGGPEASVVADGSTTTYLLHAEPN